MSGVDYLLIRQRQDDFATYGRLCYPDRIARYVTLELPWRADSRGVRVHGESRFVAGTYRLVRRKSPKRGYEVWWWCDVPDVTGAADEFPDEPTVTTAQIHIANLPDELEGCVAIGTQFGPVQRAKDPRPLPGILNSRLAFQGFMEETKNRSEIVIAVLEEWSV